MDNIDSEVWIPHKSMLTYIRNLHPAAEETTTFPYREDPKYAIFIASTLFNFRNGMKVTIETSTYVPADALRRYYTYLTLESNKTHEITVNKKKDQLPIILLRFLLPIRDNLKRFGLVDWLEKGVPPDEKNKLANLIRMIVSDWSELLRIVVQIPTGDIPVNIENTADGEDRYGLMITYTLPCFRGIITQTKTFSFQQLEEIDKSIVFVFKEMNKTIKGGDVEKQICYEEIKQFIAKELGIKKLATKYSLRDIEHRIDNILLQSERV
jgi:hypothetical protein